MVRRILVGVVAVGLAGTVAACGGSSDGEAAEVFNPCDLLDAEALANAVDSSVVVDMGDSAAPQCTLVPAEDGKAVLDINYMQWTNLADAWDSMDAAADLRYTSPDIGDAARMVVQPYQEMLGVTGIVESGGKVFMVNALDPEPYSVKDLKAAVTLAMTQLADGAASVTSSPSPTPSS